MINPLTSDITGLKSRLLALHQYFSEAADEKAAQKVQELAIKLVQGEFGIAFCGHFSAGKSRMINQLLGENLLPSSPIPTSANLVRVHAGEEYAAVYFRQGRPRKYLAPYDYELVRSYCRDGDQIASLELSRADIHLPKGVVLLDTPGIDSADDAHRIATESALHLADLIFYVMDYNHVQSELNFRFTRELTAAGKQVCLVVNQIDKHSSDELSLADFKASTERSFAAWGVHPNGIFYTSLLPDAGPENEFPRLQAFLQAQLTNRAALQTASARVSLERIVREHLQQVHVQTVSDLQPAYALLAELSTDEQRALLDECRALTAEKNFLTARTGETELRQGIQKIMDNAYLMPFSTRSLAETYLEACQPDFKTGFFFRGKKTQQEREARLQVLYDDLAEKTRSLLEWHLRSLLLDFARQRQIEDAALTDSIKAFQLLLPRSILTDSVKEGARLTQDGGFVMNYTENVAQSIKTFARQALQPLCQELLNRLTARSSERLAVLEQRLTALGPRRAALASIADAEAAEEAAAADLKHLLQADLPAADDSCSLFQPAAVELEIIPGQTSRAAAQAEVSTPPVPTALPPVPASSPAALSGAAHQLPQRLHLAASLLQPLPGLSRLAAELAEAAARLEHKEFLVTLFGAFSAGKSSFANALLGERLLPVSPNPTTAAISKICPTDDQHPHGTVHIKLKSADMLLADLNRIFGRLDSAAHDLEEAAALARKAGESLHGEARGHLSFLRAFLQGYAAAAPRLGQLLTVSLADFPAYAAQEDKACFVEWMEVYFDCPLTRCGITLVDTPGADSINARHTEASFDFIRRSDAVLFVTYYNHAFSRVDREFLIQLGRVKDAFELDKMFFIVNAIDLAADEQEKNEVLAYVRSQLLKYGVKAPQLYALSSQQLLTQKLAGRKERPAFEQAFYRFVTEDLAALSAQAAAREYERARQLLHELITASQEDAARRAQRRESLTRRKAQLLAALEGETADELQLRLKQETEELIYYMKQRVFLRFDEFFRESFNPSVLKIGTQLQPLLRRALSECLESLGFDFAQELRATSVRLEHFWQKSSRKWQQSLLHRLKEADAQLLLSPAELSIELPLTFAPAFCDGPQDSCRDLLKLFKSPHAFFEEGGSHVLAEALQQRLTAAADPYLAEQKQRLQQACQTAIEAAFPQLLQHLTEQTEDFYQSQLAALQSSLSAADLQAIERQLGE